MLNAALRRRALVTGTVITSTVLGATVAAHHAQAAAPSGAESHVTGDAWVRYPGDLEYPYRRFVVDAHGGPWKIVNNRMVMGDAHGTVRFDHYAPDEPGQ